VTHDLPFGLNDLRRARDLLIELIEPGAERIACRATERPRARGLRWLGIADRIGVGLVRATIATSPRDLAAATSPVAFTDGADELLGILDLAARDRLERGVLRVAADACLVGVRRPIRHAVIRAQSIVQPRFREQLRDLGRRRLESEFLRFI